MDISDREIRERLTSYGFNPPPVTDSSRGILLKKLQKFESSSTKANSSATVNGHSQAEPQSRKSKAAPPKPEDTASEKYDNFKNVKNDVPRSTRHSRKELDDVDFDAKRVKNSTPILDKFMKHDPFEAESDSDDSYSTRRLAQTSLLARKPLNIRRETEYFSTPAYRKYETDSSNNSYLNRYTQRNRLSSSKNSSWAKISSKVSFNKITPSVILSLCFVFFLLVGCIYYSKNDRIAGELVTDNVAQPFCSLRGREGVTCVNDKDMKNSIVAVKALYRALHAAEVDAICNGNKDASTFVTVENATELLIREFDFFKYEADNMLKNLIVLVKANPAFKIMWNEKENIFRLYNPELSWSCQLKQWFYVLCGYTFQLVAAVGLLFSMNILFQWYKARHNEHDEGIQDLVKGILDILQQNAICNPNQPYMPIVHVRDQLISYVDRERKKKLWYDALKYVEEHESRIRKEVQPITGEDYDVWRWLGGTQQSASPSPKPKTWQGEAFENTTDNMNTPLTSPTPCLKIRNMFNLKKETADGDWVTVVKDAILERCESINIVHISVDESSSDGCVYIKCASTEDAGKAYRKMHGAWFDGEIVSVKYLRLERYHERFPNSINFTSPLFPSNDQKRSIV